MSGCEPVNGTDPPLESINSSKESALFSPILQTTTPESHSAQRALSSANSNVTNTDNTEYSEVVISGEYGSVPSEGDISLGSDASPDTSLNNTIIDLTNLYPRNQTPRQRKGRPTKAQRLGKKLGKKLSTPSITKWCGHKKREGEKISPSLEPINKKVKLVVIEGYKFDRNKSFTPTLSTGCASLQLEGNMGDQQKEDAILEAIRKIDVKLNGITADLKKVTKDSHELRTLYGNLEKQLKDNDEKHNDRCVRIESRIDKLENHCKELQPIDIGDRIHAEVEEQVQALVATTMTRDSANPFSVTSVLEGNITTKLNEVLEMVDANERKEKKLNVVIQGLDSQIMSTKNSIINFISRKFNVDEEISEVTILPDNTKAIIKLPTWEIKKKIMSTKKEVLANTRVFVNSDLTRRELKTAAILRKLAKEKREAGSRVKIGHQQLQIDDKWYKWDIIGQRLYQSEKKGPLQDMIRWGVSQFRSKS